MAKEVQEDGREADFFITIRAVGSDYAIKVEAKSRTSKEKMVITGRAKTVREAIVKAESMIEDWYKHSD